MSDDTEKAPAYQWYPRDHATDERVVLMTLEEEGAYRRLLDHQWLHGSIPADVVALAAICHRIPVARMRRIWRAVGGCFCETADAGEGRMQNRRLERVREEQERYRERRRQSGSIGGQVKAERRRQRGKGSSKNVAPLESCYTETPSKNVAPLGSRYTKPPSKPLAKPVANPSTASATATAKGTTPTVVVVVPAGGASDDADDAKARARFVGQVPEPYRDAVEGAFRAARNPTALRQELDAIVTGMHPPAHDHATIGHALHDMAVAGAEVKPVVIRAFCRRLHAEASTPTTTNGARRPSPTHRTHVPEL